MKFQTYGPNNNILYASPPPYFVLCLDVQTEI
jgi:hypothetical protein